MRLSPRTQWSAKSKSVPAFLREPFDIIHMYSKHVRTLADSQF